VGQSGSRATVQSQIVAVFNMNGNKVSTVLGTAVALEGLWINELAFSEQIELGYRSGLALSDSYQESYETTQLEYQRTRLQSLAAQQEISLLKQTFTLNALSLFSNRYSSVLSTDLSS
jgi:methionine-rich copper-binding protein CopC